MRTTVRIDDDLLQQVKQIAESREESVTKAFNRVLEAGLEAFEVAKESRAANFRQRSQPMGRPLIDIDKALSISLELDDIERLQKLERQLRESD